MSVTNSCEHCGKSLLSHHQLKRRKYIGEGWDRTNMHYNCWRDLRDDLDLQHITEGMAKLTLSDQAQCGPATSGSPNYLCPHRHTYFLFLTALAPSAAFSFAAFTFALATLTAAAAACEAAASSFFFIISSMCSRVQGYGPVGGCAPLVCTNQAL